MKIVYDQGPERIWIGPINDQIEFRIGEPKEIQDDLAEKILAKKTIVFRKVEDE